LIINTKTGLKVSKQMDSWHIHYRR